VTGWSIAYYVYCLSCLAFLAVLIVSVHRLMWLAYAGQALVVMVYLAALDGDLARWLGLRPSMEPLLWLLGATAVNVYSFLMLASVMQPGAIARRFRPWLLGLAALSGVPALLSVGLPLTLLHTGALCLLLLAFLGQLIPPLTWGFLPKLLRTRAMPVILLVLLAAVVLAEFAAGALMLSADQWLIARRTALVCITTAGVITMVYMTYLIERTRAASARRALAAAEQNAATNLALLEAERAYSRARDLAATHNRRLSDASHDLRQPLSSLRLMVDDMPAGAAQSEKARALDALDYLDALARSFVGPAESDGAQARSEVAEPTETVPVELFLQNLRRMFGPEADSKDVLIRTVPSSLQLRVPPLPLMRILSNLMANALAHAQCRRILLGAQRRGDRVFIAVVDDGLGTVAQPCSDLRSDRVPKGPTGNGLAIVQALSARHGFGWQVFSKPGRGTHMRVAVPRAQDPATGSDIA
jgi:signal transduction histidine kinase